MTGKRSLLHEWCEKGAIAQENLDKALDVSRLLPDARGWRHFLDRLLLLTGFAALSCSVIFFFAYNWDAMGRFAKFGLLESAIIVSVAGYWRFDPQQPTGKGALFMAVILLGGLLALFGQTYQTGADPWQLFAIWALLSLPWVLVGCTAPLWLIWTGLVNISIYLYFSVFTGLLGFSNSFEAILLSAFIFNTSAHIAWELAASRISWLQQRYAVRMIALISGTAVSGLALQAILDWHDSSGLSAALYPIWLAGIYFSYRVVVKDLFMLAGLCLSLIIIITALLSRTLLDHDDAGGFLLIAAAVIAMSASSAVWLKRIHGENEEWAQQ